MAISAGDDGLVSEEGAARPSPRAGVGRPVARAAPPGSQCRRRADACWVPIAPGLTPHGLRHSYQTLMVELGTPGTLMDAQMGHADGSVQARYAHVTSAMTERLPDGLTGMWGRRWRRVAS
jgi:integrase